MVCAKLIADFIFSQLNLDIIVGKELLESSRKLAGF
jgi:hypothetical protein